PPHLVRAAIDAALAEDIGRGDITTDALIPPGARGSARLMARQAGILAGLDLAAAAFRTLDPGIAFAPLAADGDRIDSGAVLARISGSTRALLSGERVALNFLTHLSGIASLTRRYVDAVDGTKA